MNRVPAKTEDLAVPASSEVCSSLAQAEGPGRRGAEQTYGADMPAEDATRPVTPHESVIPRAVFSTKKRAGDELRPFTCSLVDEG